MSGYGSVQATVQRTNFPIQAGRLNEIRLHGNPNATRSQLGALLTSQRLPPSSQLERLQGASRRYLNLGRLVGQDSVQDWRAINTLTPVVPPNADKPRPALSSTSPDRPPAIAIAKGQMMNQEASARNRFVLKNQRTFTYLPQRPQYQMVGKI